ncbi:aldehyde dehydrogenase family protein [Sarcina sp. JB2]|uniref:Aldehyde dehydrogenase family protein n=1 Tax=Candidatus Sarcina troglodytae TaxID=2726954 RepID=A0ACD1BCQ6_9CLOT|nr:aldehyde dehydrogenase family protein [Sarcina sp. JB2]QPJ85296.1 aldehyde dehydrogenase family protein [Sarcina sp. JB2]
MYFSDEYKQLYKDIQYILYKQDKFLEKRLISINKRIEALKSLKGAIKYYESDIMTALKKDLGKCSFEAYSTEVGFIYSSISYVIKNIRKWNKIKKVKSEVAQWIGKSLIYKSPYGKVLIIGPYNYPYLKAQKNPLALYVFTENMCFGEYIIKKFSFGGGCINDTISHVASKSLPFGGVGTSGMGRYHGKSSFDCFTYEKVIVKKSTKIELKLVFPPYKNRLVLVKKFFMK